MMQCRKEYINNWSFVMQTNVIGHFPCIWCRKKANNCASVVAPALFYAILFYSVLFNSILYCSHWFICYAFKMCEFRFIVTLVNMRTCKVTVTSHGLEMIYDQLWPKLNDCVMHCLRCHFKCLPQLTNSHEQKWITHIYYRRIWFDAGLNLIFNAIYCDMFKWNKKRTLHIRSVEFLMARVVQQKPQQSNKQKKNRKKAHPYTQWSAVKTKSNHILRTFIHSDYK